MKESDKWILFAPELFRAPGGIARVSRHYLQALAESREGRALSVLVLNDDQIAEKDLAACHAADVQATGCNRSKLKCARTLLRETKGQSVHITCTHVRLAPLLRFVQMLRPEVTFDIVVHGIEVWGPLPRWQQSALREARLILSVSDYTRRELVTRYPELDVRTQVLPNALDPGFSPPDSQSADEHTVEGRILTVSRLAAHDWEKGIDHLIEAMVAVRAKLANAHLHVVGDGIDRNRLEGIARQSEAPEAITFLGRVDDDTLRRELESCQLFALPSRKEGFGLVYLEAMAAGKPCIVANAGGAPEVIDSNSGVVIPYGETNLLAQTLIEAMRNTWDTGKIKQRAQQFSFPAFVERWRGLSSLAE